MDIKGKWNNMSTKGKGCVVLIIISILFTAVSSVTNNASENQVEEPSTSENIAITPSITDNTKLQYELIKENHNSSVENFYIYTEEENKNEETMQKLANLVKEDLCSRDCNISIFDNKEALEKDFDYMTNPPKTPEEKLAWDQENYISVADHFVALLSFDMHEIWAYPYKDWKYNELKID